MRNKLTSVIMALLAGGMLLGVAASAAGESIHSGAALAQTTVTLAAVADATVKSWQPDTNFGSEGVLELSYSQIDVPREAVTLLRFDLASGLPGNAIIDSAVLKLWLVGAAGADPVGVGAYYVTSGWSESSVTWNSFPTADPLGILAQVGATPEQYETWGVTGYAQAWHSGANHGLYLRGPTDGTYYERVFESREWMEHVPQLEVTYHLPPQEPYAFGGNVYQGSPPDRSRPVAGVTVELYGDEDEWPEAGFEKVRLASTATGDAGEFTVVWEGEPFPYFHVMELDPPGAFSTGAEAAPPGYVKNLNVVSYVDTPPDHYGGIAFWDEPLAPDTPTATTTESPTETPTPTSTRATHTPTASPTPTTTLPPNCQELLVNGDFESGSLAPWSQWGPVNVVGWGRNSVYSAALGGVDHAQGELWQSVTIPAAARPVRLELWWLAEAEIGQPDDAVDVIIQYDGEADRLRTLRAAAPVGLWRQGAVDLTDYAGRTVFLTFFVHTDGEVASTFHLDDVRVQACGVSTATPTNSPTPTATDVQTGSPTTTRTPTKTATPSRTPTSTPTITPTPTATVGTICSLEDVSPGPGSTPQPISWKASLWGKMLSLSITGVEGAVGPATSWSTINGGVLVEHLAAADENGKLILFYAYPGSDWKAVNISEKTGATIAIVQPESWVFTDTVHVLERIAAPATNGDLMVFTWHSGSDWQATNLSTATGKKIIGPVTSWTTTLGSSQVEHIAARATNNDLLVFWRTAGGNWAVVNVTALTGQKIGGPGTSGAYRSGSTWVEYVAAQAPNGDLILFTFLPSTNWQWKNLSQLTGQKVGGRATDWIAPTGARVEYLAAPAPNNDLVIFYSDPIEGGWHVQNVTNITGQRVAGPATNWLVPDGSVWWEHVGARGPNDHVYVFFRATGGTWGVVDVTNLTNQTITGIPTSWTIAEGSGFVEKLAAPSWDGHMHLFSFTPATNWETADVSLKAAGRAVYAASERAGVWWSGDYGINWSQLTRPQPAQGAQTVGGLDTPVVHDAAVSPKDPRLVVAATGDDRRNPSLAGIYRSTDRGLTWTRVHTFTFGAVVQPATQVIFAPDDPTTLYAAGGSAIAISSDSGRTWTEVVPSGVAFNGSRVWHVAVSPLLPGDVRTAFACGSGSLWYSPDSGQNWYRDNGIGGVVPAGFCAPTSLGRGDAAQTLAIDPDNPDRVYLARQGYGNGPSYFHPADAGPDGVHCNNAVVYDADNDNIYDSGELVLYGHGALPGLTLNYDANIKYVESVTNTQLDASEAVIHDANGDGVYNAIAGMTKNEVVLRGTAPPVGTLLSNDAKIKHVARGTPFGPRQCGEASLWYGDLSGFDPAHPNQLSGSWSQLPGPPVFWGGTASGAAFVYTHVTDSSYLVFFADQDSLYVSASKPTEGSWHRLDGWDPSRNKRENKLYTIWDVHIDSHGLAISPDLNLTLKPVTDQRSPYNLNTELDKCKGGRLWYSNDGGVYRSDDCGKTWITPYSGLSTLATINIGGVARPGTDPALYFGCGDNDDYFSLDAGATWRSGVDNCADCGVWYGDPAQPNRILGTSRTIPGVFAVYINPSGYPDPSQASHKNDVPEPTPPTGTVESKLYVLPGYRPMIQTLASEAPLANGDYVVIQELVSPAPSRRLLWRARDSINTASPWTQEGPDLPGSVTVVQAGGGHSAPTYYVGDNTNLWKSHRDAQGNIDQWAQVVPGGAGADRATRAWRFMVNPYNGDEVYIVDSNGVRHTTDGGNSWPVDTLLDQALTAGGEFIYSCGNGYQNFDLCVLNDMAFERQSPQRRFAVGLAGAFYSGDGTNWFRIVDTRALPSRPVGVWFNPISDPVDRSVYLAFLGRGVMRCSPIPVQAPPPVPTPIPSPGPTRTPLPSPTPTLRAPGTSLIEDGGFETGGTGRWEASGAVEVVGTRAHSGRYSARMGQYLDSVDELSQTILVPDRAGLVTLSYWWFIESDDRQPWADTLQVLAEWQGGATILEELTNSDTQYQWRQSWFDLSAFRGQWLTITFRGTANGWRKTLFYMDDIVLGAHGWRVLLPVVLKDYGQGGD